MLTELEREYFMEIMISRLFHMVCNRAYEVKLMLKKVSGMVRNYSTDQNELSY